MKISHVFIISMTTALAIITHSMAETRLMHTGEAFIPAAPLPPYTNIIYSAHYYFGIYADITGGTNPPPDNGWNGTYNTPSQAASCDTAPPYGINIGACPFTRWLEAQGVSGNIGEVGIPVTDPRFWPVLEGALTYWQAHNISVFYANFMYANQSGKLSVCVRSCFGDGNQGAAVAEIIFKHSAPWITGYSSTTLRGGGASSSTVKVYDNGNLLGTTSSNSATGSWSYNTGALANGVHNLTVTNSHSSSSSVCTGGTCTSLGSNALSISVSGGVATVGAMPARKAYVGVLLEGTENSFHTIPEIGDLDYLKSKGVSVIRAPFAWEFFQGTLFGPLTYSGPWGVDAFKTMISQAVARDMSVVITPMNFGGYNVNWKNFLAQKGWFAPGINYSAAETLGGSSTTIAAFADLWGKVAAAFVGTPGLAGYDLMNEPHNLSSNTVWPNAAKLAIKAIRGVDRNTPIYLEGDNWSYAGSWPTATWIPAWQPIDAFR